MTVYIDSPKMVVQLLWARGELNPVDVPSHRMTYDSPDDMVFDVLKAKATLDLETIHTPMTDGAVHYKGWRKG